MSNAVDDAIIAALEAALAEAQVEHVPQILALARENEELRKALEDKDD